MNTITMYNANMALHFLHEKMGGNKSYSNVERYEKVLQIFDLHNDDCFVISFQECTAKEYNILNKLLPQYCSVIGHHCETRLSLEYYNDEDFTGLCNITVFNKTLMSPTSIDFVVGEGKKHGAMFDKLIPIVTFSIGDCVFKHVNIHFPAPFRGHDERLITSQKIINVVDDIPIFIVGDFNTVERFDGVETINFLEQHLQKYIVDIPWIGYINDDY